MSGSLTYARCALGLCLALSPGTPARAQSFTCAAAQDPRALELHEFIVSLVTAPAQDAELVEGRDRHRLPALPASAVSVETKPPTCKAAGTAYNAAVQAFEAPASRWLIVVKVGANRWIVQDPQARLGHYSTWVIFDQNWNVLAWITG